MQRNNKRHRHDLRAIARRVMTERGLLPDFSPAVMGEMARIQAAATDGDSETRDLRELLWCSIDNDDSRDLDQLTLAELLPGGAVKILVAIADVDALVKQGSAIDGHARPNSGLASRLSYYEIITGDYRYMTRYIQMIEKVTPTDIMAAAKKYLVEENRTVAVLVKKEKP